MGWRFTARGVAAPHSGIDTRWRDLVCVRTRSFRHRAQYPAHDPHLVGPWLRRIPLAVAVLPARRSDRDPRLDPDATVQCAARPLARPAFGGDRCRVVADHRGKGISVAALDRGSEIGLDLVHHSDAAV